MNIYLVWIKIESYLYYVLKCVPFLLLLWVFVIDVKNETNNATHFQRFPDRMVDCRKMTRISAETQRTTPVALEYQPIKGSGGWKRCKGFERENSNKDRFILEVIIYVGVIIFVIRNMHTNPLVVCSNTSRTLILKPVFFCSHSQISIFFLILSDMKRTLSLFCKIWFLKLCNIEWLGAAMQETILNVQSLILNVNVDHSRPKQKCYFKRGKFFFHKIVFFSCSNLKRFFIHLFNMLL